MIVETYDNERIAKMNKFTLDDIRIFDILTLRSGEKTLVLKGIDEELIMFDKRGNVVTLSCLDRETLTWNGAWHDDIDIMEVRRTASYIHKDKRRWEEYPIIWKRNEIKEMTMDEICKELGYEVKIVGEEPCMKGKIVDKEIRMKGKLKRCPCCGHRAGIKHVKLRYATDYYLVICRTCGVQTRKYKTAEGARTAWNKRVK